MTDKILIVDDDEINTLVVKKRLEGAGFEVQNIYDPELIDQSLKKFQPDLILLDIMMPKISGDELLKELRKTYDKITLPVIMMTAKSETEDVVKLLGLGANDYLTKPLNFDIAVSRINSQLTQKKLKNESLRKKELEVITSMVATYNHEINNPLFIAFGFLERIKKSPQNSKKEIERLEKALIRIDKIVKDVSKIVEENNIDFQHYGETTKILKVK